MSPTTHGRRPALRAGHPRFNSVRETALQVAAAVTARAGRTRKMRLRLRLLVATLGLIGACASAPPKSWEDFGVDSSIVTPIDSISDEEALRIVRTGAPTATAPAFSSRERERASAWFRLDPPFNGRDSAHAAFERGSNGWSAAHVELGIGRVLLGSDVDAAIARRLISWLQSSGKVDAPAEVTRVKSGDAGGYDLVFSYDGTQKNAEGCICVSWLPVRILEDDTVVADEMQEGGCFLYGPTG